jgi:hypothetical protein
MRLQLNDEAITQLEFIMGRTGYANKQHCIQVMLSTIANNLRRSGRSNTNKQAESK